jgi:hypothetical protein
VRRLPGSAVFVADSQGPVLLLLPDMLIKVQIRRVVRQQAGRGIATSHGRLAGRAALSTFQGRHSKCGPRDVAAVVDARRVSRKVRRARVFPIPDLNTSTRVPQDVHRGQ